MSKEPRKKEGDGTPREGVSRRQFLSTAGVGVVGLAAVGTDAPKAGDDTVVAAGEMIPLTLRINGRRYRLLVEPRWSLAHILREELGLTGTKHGCDRGECGSCSVLIGDEPRYACLTLAVEAEERPITTVEGLLIGEALGPVQEAFADHDAFQCGYCTPGQIIAVEGLLRSNAHPSVEEIRLGVSGNLCRCGAYPNIYKAASQAAELRRDQGGTS